MTPNAPEIRNGSARLLHSKQATELIGSMTCWTAPDSLGWIRIAVFKEAPQIQIEPQSTQISLCLDYDIALDFAAQVLQLVAQNRALRREPDPTPVPSLNLQAIVSTLGDTGITLILNPNAEEIVFADADDQVNLDMREDWAEASAMAVIKALGAKSANS